MEYTTQSYEPWDFIAKKVYGNERYADILMEENPQYIKFSILPPNTTINVPKIQIPQPSQIPPWRK